jgi:hypothetical protein
MPAEPLPAAEATPVEQSPEYLKLFDYHQAHDRIDKLIKAWSHEKEKTKIRRNMRNIEVDIDQLHRSGKLKAADTLIPVRVIDSGMEKEKPPYISFITQSRRLGVFVDKQDPHANVEIIENEFSKGMRYPKWERSWFQPLDGGQLHGWDWVEVEYSESKPLGVNIDHIGHDKLLFPTDSEDIQANDLIAREYELTVTQLRKFVTDFGFDATETENLIAREIKDNEPKNIKVYKCWWKYDKIVYVAWYANEQCNNWIKAPEPLWRGKQIQVEKMVEVSRPILGGLFNMPAIEPQMFWEKEYETRYPVHPYYYQETEEKQIMRHKGRAFKDGPSQEAQTALLSSYVNGSVRSSNVYASPKQRGQDSSGKVTKIDVTLEHDCIYSEPMEFWGPAFPPLDLLKGLSALETQKSVENGQVAYAVNNREESRKTATEIQSANKENALLNSVEVTLFSTFVREVLIDCWSIVQSLAMQDLIVFMPIQVPTGVDPMTMQPIMSVQNNKDVIGRDYEIYAAGDVDVIQRAEKRQKRQILWPIISQTAAALPFLMDIIREELPEDADKYIAVLEQAQMMQAQAAAQGMGAQPGEPGQQEPPQ